MPRISAVYHLLLSVFCTGLLAASPAHALAPDAKAGASTAPPSAAQVRPAELLAPTVDPDAEARRAVADRQLELMLTTLEVAVKRDEFIENLSGLSRTSGQFDAVRKGLGAIYADRPLMRSLLKGIDTESTGWETNFRRNWAMRMASGMGRLSDESAMKLLRPLADTMSRFSPEQCASYGNGKARKVKNVFTEIMLPAMNAAEVQMFFDGFHDALIADLAALPMRPLPDATQLSQLMAKIDGMVPGTNGTPPKANECEALGQVVKAIDQLEQPQRSLAITYLMTVAGFHAQKVSAQ